MSEVHSKQQSATGDALGSRCLSLDQLSGLGFRTFVAAYYGAANLKNPKGLLEALVDALGAMDIIYTSWRYKYALLRPFGDLVSRKK